MEKEPKLEKSQIPFDIDGLLDSDISITHEKNSKFFETKNEPDKVIRIENLEELKSKHKNKFELIELVEIAKKLFRELEEKYSILAPVNIFLFKDKNDKEVVCSVVDKISGEHLGKVEKSDETISKIKTLSARRAKAVANAIRHPKTTHEGIGETKLLYTNDLPEGRFYCRTVDIVVETPIHW